VDEIYDTVLAVSTWRRRREFQQGRRPVGQVPFKEEEDYILRAPLITGLRAFLIAAVVFSTSAHEWRHSQALHEPSYARESSTSRIAGASEESKRERADDSAIRGNQFIRTSGRSLIGENNKEIFLRGVVFSSSSLSPPAEEDYQDVAKLNMNAVRLMLEYRLFYEPDAPNSYKEDAWQWLDAHIALARKHHIYLILQMGDVEGAQFVPTKRFPFDYRIWNDGQLQDRFVNLWRAIAERYKNEAHIAGYSLFCEPVVSGTVEQWLQLANRTVKEIRRTDRNHILFIERIYGENGVRREMSGVDLPPEKAFFLVDDTNAVYEFYFFESDEYTHQFAPWRADVQKSIVYPDQDMKIIYKEEPDRAGKAFDLNKDYLRFYLRRQTEFGKKHNVPMFVWGFGLIRNCFEPGKGGAPWLTDVTDLFTAEALSWTFYSYYDKDFVSLSDSAEAKRILSQAAEKQ
jgi:hypothetical protein